MKHPIVASLLTVFTFLAAGSPACAAGVQPDSLPKPSPEHLPRWRGFNLLEKFQRDRSGPFLEEDFRLIQELGFNFVRLPMDYRSWIRGEDWTQFHEASLKEIDQAVAWGGKYGIHVLINFHRAPGYTVARPPERKSLWTDPEAQRVCAMHWAEFARRCRGIPNERLSFNLFNEPANVEPEVYIGVVEKIAAAIRAEDPQRLIVSDGLQWGKHPVLELADLKIAQATRGYVPMDITHYKASWVAGSDQYPVPTWPRPQAYGTLYAPHKGGLKPESLKPMVVEGPFETETRLRLHVMSVSSQAMLVARADGEKVWENHFQCGDGKGEWKKSEYQPQWKIYRCTYDRDYEVTIPSGTRRVEVAVTGGDWMTLTEIGLKRPNTAEDVLTLRAGWDEPPATVRYEPSSSGSPFVSRTMEDRQWLWDTMIVPWNDARAKRIGVMVGEFGAFNRTPHDVVLAWMEDCLANWQKAGFGWALWNFRGPFGILDSGREDVQYEDFHGHQLDRKMLELLKRY